MIRTHFSIKILLSSVLMLHSLTAIAQGGLDDGSDMGSDPGLPAEAPPAPVQQQPQQQPQQQQQQQAPAPRSNRTAPSATMPAPQPEQPLVQPYDGPSAPAVAPMPQRPRPAVTGKLAELNLTPEQAQAIVDLRRQWKPETEKRLKDEFVQLKQGLAQSMADNSPAEDVRKRFELMQKKYLELQTVKFEKLLRIREVLTPEQRRKFAELRSRPAGKNSGNDND